MNHERAWRPAVPMIKFLRDRKVRDVLWQVVATIALIAVIWFFVRNASQNLVKAGIASGFNFLWRDSGIEVPFTLTGYKPSDNILALLWVGVVNTLLVSACSIAVATVIGFTVGLLRLSRNWLLSTLAGVYIEFVRNIPLLFFVLFWYFGVLAALPAPRESLSFLDVAFLNRRGLSIPLPLALFGTVGALTKWDVPVMRGFNYRGGFVMVPEFVALFAALSTYTAGF